MVCLQPSIVLVVVTGPIPTKYPMELKFEDFKGYLINKGLKQTRIPDKQRVKTEQGHLIDKLRVKSEQGYLINRGLKQSKDT